MKSTISASMHKAGSTIMDKILADVMKFKGYELNRIAFRVPKSPLTEREVFLEAQSEMEPDGGVYYGVARGPYVADMPALAKLKVIVQVRDPRDCITSAYFSFKESHTAPKDPEKAKNFMERRRKLEALDIDEYVLTQVAGYKRRMQILQELTSDHDDALLLRYEDMVLDTDGWLGKISAFIDQPITPELVEILGEKIDFTVKSEDASKHKRQVTPGDHLRKLKPETIKKMTAQMKDELQYFGYDC